MMFSVVITLFGMLLDLCHLSASEPPPLSGASAVSGYYGPASPVEFSDSRKQPNNGRYADGGAYQGPYGSYSEGSVVYHAVGGGDNQPAHRSSFTGSKSNSGKAAGSGYISIIHAAPKSRPYSAGSGPGLSYSKFNKFSPAANNKGSSSYINAEFGSNKRAEDDNGGEYGNSFPKSALPSAGFGSAESEDYSTNGGNQAGYEFPDDVASYGTSGGPTYSSGPYRSAAAAVGSHNGRPIRSGYGGNRGSEAYSTMSFTGHANYGGRIGHQYTPSSSKSTNAGFGKFAQSGFPKVAANSAEAASVESDDEFVGAYSSNVISSPPLNGHGGAIKVQTSYTAES